MTTPTKEPLMRNFPPEVLSDDDRSLRVVSAGAASDGARSTREVEHILRSVVDDDWHAIRFVEVT